MTNRHWVQLKQKRNISQKSVCSFSFSPTGGESVRPCREQNRGSHIQLVLRKHGWLSECSIITKDFIFEILLNCRKQNRSAVFLFKHQSRTQKQGTSQSMWPPRPFSAPRTNPWFSVCVFLCGFFCFVFLTLSHSIVSALLASSLICILVGAALLFVWTSWRGKHKHTRNCCPSVCVFHASVSLYVFGSISGKHRLVFLLKAKKKKFPSSLRGDVRMGLTLGVSAACGGSQTFHPAFQL